VCLSKLFPLRNAHARATHSFRKQHVVLYQLVVSVSTRLAEKTAYLPHLYLTITHAQNPEHVEDFTERVVGVLKDR
jgi:hypothetical protein